MRKNELLVPLDQLTKIDQRKEMLRRTVLAVRRRARLRGCLSMQKHGGLTPV
jgi:hypothetical protein